MLPKRRDNPSRKYKFIIIIWHNIYSIKNIKTKFAKKIDNGSDSSYRLWTKTNWNRSD